MGQGTGQNNRQDGDKKKDRGTARGKNGTGVWTEMEKEAAGEEEERQKWGGQERERKIRTGGRIEIAKKAWCGQQDGEGAEKNRGRGQDRRI